MEEIINYENKSKEELIDLLKRQSEQIKTLTEYLALARQRQFGTKSEKFNANQLNFFDEAVLPKNPEIILQAEDEICVASFVRKKSPGRKALPSDLPRETIVYDLPEEEKICTCGCALTHIFDDKSEQLEIIQPKIYVIQHVRKKYACRECEETIKTAPYPKQPIPRSIAAPGLLSHVLVSKFQDHLPLYRQEQILRRIGVDIPRATLSLWVIRCAELLKPLTKFLHKYIMSYDVAYSDETTLQVLKEPNKTVQSKKYMWLFAGGSPDKFAFYYHYHPDRSHTVPKEFFADYKGYLHCDGFPGYETLATKNNNITLSGCMYHARRKFVEVAKLSKNKDSVSMTVVNYIGQLSKIEEEIKELTAEKKLAEREEKAKPVLDELYEYLVNKAPYIPPKSSLGQAVSYTLNQWPKLLIYLKDGRLENNNNRMERAIKPFVIGRKGWLFADSVAGANAASIIYSFVETCKWHGIEPYDWFKYVLKTLPLCSEHDDLELLLPFNIDKKLLLARG
ncbi:MAG: IS66 family transposase [Gammaproteobacteria bacterium]|nr:IS66 family transposase [Gammaproteobacteria bacterium]